MAAVGVREMRAKITEAIRAEALVQESPVRVAYCQGVQDALSWAATGEFPDPLAAMVEFLETQHANGRPWSNP